MKLYTEEQIFQAMSAVRNLPPNAVGYIGVFESLTPINLPTDKDIQEQSQCHKMRWKAGAKWVLEQIEKQIKQQP